MRCDDFLTRALTGFDSLAYKTATERGGAGAHGSRQASASVSSSPQRVNKQPIVVGCHSASVEVAGVSLSRDLGIFAQS